MSLDKSYFYTLDDSETITQAKNIQHKLTSEAFMYHRWKEKFDVDSAHPKYPEKVKSNV